MESLDKRFARSQGNSSKKWTITLIGGSALLTLFFIFINLENKEDPKTVTEVSTPIKMDEPILEDKETNKVEEQNKQDEQAIAVLQPKELEHTLDRTELVELRKGKTSEEEELHQPQILMDKLNIEEVELNKQELPQLNYQIKKEIYLYDLKLVDYRPYRKERMKEEKLVMSGTPANQEAQQTSEQNFEYEEVDIPYIEYLEKSMYYFSKGMYKKALVRFNKILDHYPNDVNAHFYGGLCYYNLNEGKVALDYFEKSYSLSYGNFKEEAEWLSYLTYIDLKQNKKARALLQQIAHQGGFYSERAKDILNK
ncbi:hypothetical protein [Lishizhenia sp.]|uniref:hypothetical protein n=1 Tax=Lishizhenia sp. TaxID=2497594 RepID=UPI00299EFB14|nr:hypothetical protein [Lishizhenia sp.]MDX1446312.1 hypothetical protein [Lishizhenia sp.]